MLKGLSSSNIGATEVTAASVLTSGEAIIGDGVRGVSSARVVLTVPATAATITMTAAKTLAVTNSLTLSGTDSTVMTFPTTTATLARTDAGQTFTGTQVVGLIQVSASTTYTAAAAGPVLKQGANGRAGTFVANGATPVTVSNTSIAITDAIIISLNTVGGAGPITQPVVLTITAASGFTVGASATDTSTYNYAIIKNAA